jgi:hypothetical protein
VIPAPVCSLSPRSLTAHPQVTEAEPAARARIASRYRDLARIYRAVGEGTLCGPVRAANLNLATQYEAMAAQVQP